MDHIPFKMEVPSGRAQPLRSCLRGARRSRRNRPRVQISVPGDHLSDVDDEEEPSPYERFISRGAICLCYWGRDLYEVTIVKKSSRNRIARVTYIGWSCSEVVPFERLFRGSRSQFREARSIRREWSRTGVRPDRVVRRN